ncbi:MAG: filamentous hemagglutinin N-terminal domain-containing protein [Rhodospirillales bacterium]|nr:filamentous hemagglutinin N-terminal domain-containing protein [Rhodospirillales bacterium]
MISTHAPLGIVLRLAAVIAVAAAPAAAAPEGGKVTGGCATITQGDGITRIDQFTDKAIIDWRKFSLDASEIARFHQPGANAVALNRVRGSDPSVILGQLQANGHVFLVNPNGVVFGPGAKVDVHGLVATTADIRNDDFLAGRYRFTIPSPNPDAAVVNQGTITFGETGLAALVAPSVRNDGAIVGTLGEVTLAGAAGFSLDLQGDGLIRFGATRELVDGLSRKGALVTNSGRIEADGGRVIITADAAESVVDQAINAGGIIEARSFALAPGEIVLDGGDHGTVTVTGTLSTTGAEADARGGDIDVLGDRLTLAAGGVIDASGPAGGGSVHVGGDQRGEGGRRRASETVMEPGAVIFADATTQGDGGQVVLWADQKLVFAGTVSARGGSEGGNGGLVETSSTGQLLATGRVDTSAPGGADGSWLLDPLHVVITDNGTTAPPVLADDPPVAGTAYISPAAIAAAGGNVVIEASRTIRVNDALTAANTLTLWAGVGIVIRQPIVSSNDVRIETRDIRTTETGVITAQHLVVNSIAAQAGQPAGPDYAAFSADLVTNVGELSIGRSGDGPAFHDISIVNTGALSIEGAVSQGTVSIRSDGPLVITAPITAGGSGNTIVLAASSIDNRAGAGALDPGAGRFIIYSQSPQTNARGGLVGREIFGRTFATAPPDSLSGTGNTFVYASAAPIDDQARAVATRGTKPPPGNDPAARLAASGPELLAAPPPPSRGSDDLLFSNDGNRELWN